RRPHERRVLASGDAVGLGPRLVLPERDEGQDGARDRRRGDRAARQRSDAHRRDRRAPRARVQVRAPGREAPIRLAFSPDSDDIFMFWPLLTGKVPAEGLTFEAERADTETLNTRAERGELDVCAVSIAQ